MRDTDFTELRAIDWFISDGPVGYERAVAAMHARAAAIASGNERELVWLLEHPALYTAGTSTRPDDLLLPDRFPVHRSGRGGQLTYHGPGQRVAYVMLDVARRHKDVRAFVCALEDWIIDTLGCFGVRGERRTGRVGVWVRHPGDGEEREAKIAAVGLRLRRWVSLHGLSLNVAPNLEHYSGIVPCGIREQGMTSLAALGVPVSLHEVDAALRATFEARFGPARDVAEIAELAGAPLAAAEP